MRSRIACHAVLGESGGGGVGGRSGTMTDRTAVALLSMLVLWQTGAGHDCKDSRTIKVEEGDQVSLTCTIPGADYLAWSLTFRRPDGKVSVDQVGSCEVRSNGNTVCEVEDAADYELTSQGLPTSTLTIKRSPSTTPRVLCIGMLQSSEELTDSCNIEFHYPARKVRNCRLQWDATHWSVFGSCDVDKISPDDGEYECLWIHETSTWVNQINTHLEELGNHRVRCVFQGYVLSKANRRGSFSLKMLRRSTSSNRWLVATRFPIEKPGEPELASCPTAVTEGSDFTCLCRPSSSRPGTPRPVVTWLQGTPNNPLHHFVAKRELDGEVFTCYQYWGGWNDGDVQTVSYTIHVYPSVPKTTTVSQTLSKGDKLATIPTTIYRTTSTGGKLTTTPTTISRSTSTGGKLTTTPTTISRTTSKGGKLATTPTTVSSSGGTKDSTDDESDHGPPIVIIASAAAGGLVVIIVIIIVVVVVLKRRGGAQSTKDRSTKDKDADFEEYINDLYVSSDQCLSIHPHPHPPAAHLPDPTNQRAAAAAVSPASRDGGNAVDRDQETSFRSSTVPLARSGPAASRDRPTTNQNAGAGPSHEDDIPSGQGREPKEKTSTANNEDEYNVLNFHRGAPKTSSTDTDAVYSHIDPAGKKP